MFCDRLENLELLCLQSVLRKVLPDDAPKISDSIMAALLQMLQHGSKGGAGGVQEDALLAVSTLVEGEGAGQGKFTSSDIVFSTVAKITPNLLLWHWVCSRADQMVSILKYRATTRYRYQPLKVSRYRLTNERLTFNIIPGYWR